MLGADVLGYVAAGVADRGIGHPAVEPARKHLIGLRRPEIIDQVLAPQNAAGPGHSRDALQRERLPEAGQLMQGIAGVRDVDGRSVRVAEEPGSVPALRS